MTRLTACTLACLFTLLLSACGTSTTERLDLPPLETVESVDIERYMGQWYEIASFPQSFQEGCAGTTATYSLEADGTVRVVNRCFEETLQGEMRSATGRARAVDDSNARLEVSFFGPFWGKYWIIELGEAYDYAVVGEPGRDYLWILSRTPQMPEAQLASLITRLRDEHRFDVERLKRTLQPSS